MDMEMDSHLLLFAKIPELASSLGGRQYGALYLCGDNPSSRPALILFMVNSSKHFAASSKDDDLRINWASSLEHSNVSSKNSSSSKSIL